MIRLRLVERNVRNKEGEREREGERKVFFESGQRWLLLRILFDFLLIVIVIELRNRNNEIK